MVDFEKKNNLQANVRKKRIPAQDHCPIKNCDFVNAMKQSLKLSVSYSQIDAKEHIN